MPIIQPTLPPLPKTLSFAGKTAIVTGATAGLGFAAALQLAQRDVAILILAVRNTKAGEDTKTFVLNDPIVHARSTPPTIHIYELDLARPSSVASFATKIHADISELHILLLNAGIGTLAWGTTPETNCEQMFQVNFLSNALLALRLLPLLRSTAQQTGTPSHLTFVGSRMTRMTSFAKSPIPETSTIFGFMNDQKKYNMARYGDSKTLVAMWIGELAKQVSPADVVINNVCPGMVKTGINDSQPLWLRLVVKAVFALRARSPEVGARTFLNAVSAGEDSHGELLGDFDIEKVQFMQSSEGKKMQEKLWKETSAAAEEFAPGSLEGLTR
ncbi:hypothetical protein C8F01DRAFT_612825 [Mycena amicta]|nr:hypothetical protein C8F01DRAFT_612825 [Mycena amicta]